jgi:hypothetical protein
MKNLKTYEAKKVSDYVKYYPYLYKLFECTVRIDDRYGEINIILEKQNFNQNDIKNLHENFKDLDIIIKNKNYSTFVIIRIENVPWSFFKPFDLDIDANKYNL